MIIAITGVAGLVGSHLAQKFVSEGHEVVGIDNLQGGYLDNIPKGIQFYCSDICNYAAMQNIFKAHQVDVVYHCAALAYEGLSVFSPYLVSNNIFSGTASVLSASVSNKVKKFIFCSSMARYGNQQAPFTEDMPTHPVDPYGIAKVAAEELIQRICDLNEIEWVIVVPHNIIGKGQRYDDPYRNVVSIMINRMLQDKQPIIYGDGMQMRCFSFVEEVTDSLYLLSQLPIRSEIINIGADQGEITIDHLVYQINSVLKKDIKPIHVDGRPLEVRDAYCNSDKARQLLGYKQTIDLKQGIKSIVDYIKKRGVLPFQYSLELEINNELTPKTWKNKLI